MKLEIEIQESIYIFKFEEVGTMSPSPCVAYHIERSIANRLGLVQYPCACTRCRGGRVKKVEVIARHHNRHGRDPYLIYPTMVSYSLFNFFPVFDELISSD